MATSPNEKRTALWITAATPEEVAAIGALAAAEQRSVSNMAMVLVREALAARAAALDTTRADGY